MPTSTHLKKPSAYCKSFFVITEGIPGESYVPWFTQIRDVIIRLGGPPIRLRIQRVENEVLSREKQQYCTVVNITRVVPIHTLIF